MLTYQIDVSLYARRQNVSSSITPLKGERLTDVHSKIRWTNITWKKVEEHVSRLQTRITKAVKEQKWPLVATRILLFR
ncbi:MAG: reverse transcriptase N-terminal domain-containing protein [Euryarchaeota archaeon]|nr:reverse transcriptase N-terminal domain-containing protein [Euryarchaeota archaeon]